MTDDFNFPNEQYVLVGKVAKPHGLRGEVKVFAYSDEPETLLEYSSITLVDDNGRLSPSLSIEQARLQGRTVVLRLESIDDRSRAEALKGMGILVNKENLQEKLDGEYYWYEFYDLPVFTAAGEKVGTVTSVFSNGAQDIMVVKQGKEEILIPILDTIIQEHTDEKIVIVPPPGLLEINAAARE